MTKEKVIAYIKKDLRKLDGQISKEKNAKSAEQIKKVARQTTHLLSYLISRKQTLKEILNLLTTTPS